VRHGSVSCRLPEGNSTKAFNHWANAAAVLKVLGRNANAFDATNNALAIFPDSAFVYSLRGNSLADRGSLREAEQEFKRSAALETNGTTWSSLALISHREGRLMEEIYAWEHWPHSIRRRRCWHSTERQRACRQGTNDRRANVSSPAWHMVGRWLGKALAQQR